MNLSDDDVQDILHLLDSLPYTELTLETSRFVLQLRRSGDGWTQEAQLLSPPVLADPLPPDPAPADPVPLGPVPADPVPLGPVPAAAPLLPPAAPGAGTDLLDIVAPLPGTFYRAPQPGAAPFVEAGSGVAAETVVAIVETMKLMNPVYAGTAGTVTEICLDDGQFAGQGAVLMRVSARAG